MIGIALRACAGFAISPTLKKVFGGLSAQLRWRVGNQERAFLVQRCNQYSAEIRESLPQGDGKRCDVEDESFVVLTNVL